MLKKSFVGFSLIAIISTCLVGCGSDGVKPDESMESTFKQAKKDNPNAKPPDPKSSKVGGPMPKVSAENNGPATP